MKSGPNSMIWEYAVKRIADPKLKAEDYKYSAAAANLFSAYTD